MSAESSQSRNELVRAHVALAHMADAGQLDALPCPQCKEASVAVWFHRSKTNEYRTWFICEQCGFHTRLQNTGRPKHYSKERLLPAKEMVPT